MSFFFAKLVNQKMDEKGLGVRELARIAAIDASFFSKVLSGKRNPPSDEKIITKIASALDIDPDYLIFSAGRVPSRFSKIFRDPSIVVYIESYGKSSPAPARPVRTRQPAPERKYIPKKDLSEELL